MTSQIETRIFRGDKWTRAMGSRIPHGSTVNVVKFCPHRTVIVEYMGEKIITKLWCLGENEGTRMIDLADGRPRRRYRNGATVALYPCARCGKNLVVKKDKMCRKCACRTREENYIARGIKHPVNTTFADPAKTAKFARRKHGGRNGSCAAHWMIDERNFGRCLKCDSKTLICQDTGLPCPHNGMRDFAALQEKHAHRFNFLESCTKGGNVSGQKRGGKRGRPRKIKEAI